MSQPHHPWKALLPPPTQPAVSGTVARSMAFTRLRSPPREIPRRLAVDTTGPHSARMCEVASQTCGRGGNPRLAKDTQGSASSNFFVMDNGDVQQSCSPECTHIDRVKVPSVKLSAMQASSPEPAVPNCSLPDTKTQQIPNLNPAYCVCKQAHAEPCTRGPLCWKRIPLQSIYSMEREENCPRTEHAPQPCSLYSNIIKGTGSPA